MSQFPIHGSVKVDVEERMLLVEGRGPWNLEAVLEFEIQAVPLLKKLNIGPWGSLVELHGETIFVPDAAESVSRIICEQKRLGRIATAMIVDQSNTSVVFKQHLGHILDEAGETYQFFTNKGLAKLWLSQKIAQASIP